MQSDADVRPSFVGRIKRFSAATFALRLSFGNDRCKVAATVFSISFATSLVLSVSFRTTARLTPAIASENDVLSQNDGFLFFIFRIFR